MFLDIDLTNPTILPTDSVQIITRNIIEQMKSDPTAFWTNFMQSALNFGLKVVAALLIYIVGSWIISRIKKVLKRVFIRRKTERTLASFITSFVTISLTILLVIITVSTLGVNTTSLAALLAAGGMAIGMALSGTVQNFAGGIMLLAFKPFKAGDFIEAQGVSGTVVEVSITSTRILTTDNRVIILPNGALSNGTIDNYSARPFRRVEWQVSVAYGSDADNFKQTVLQMLQEDTRVLQADANLDKLYKEMDISAYQLNTVGYRMSAIPAPFVALSTLNENDITFVIRAWVRASDFWNVFFNMQERFYTELPQHGFAFAYPHVDVTMVAND
ncbi:MAG: mechanosensitive ion channel [Paludibacteraceae bacterium]|nr:mechanosensitive ion channel [Paludibacteraceae bacterium]